MTFSRQEIEHLIHDIHDFFTDWVGGRCPGDAETFQTRALNRISDDLVAIFPAGQAHGKADFKGYMSSIYGSNPEFRIKIRDISIPHVGKDLAVANYREWQRGAKDSEKANNGRITTMVIGARPTGVGLEIRQVHETWLPREEEEAGDYDF